jgi:uncharacterized protein YvpB
VTNKGIKSDYIIMNLLNKTTEPEPKSSSILFLFLLVIAFCTVVAGFIYLRFLMPQSDPNIQSDSAVTPTLAATILVSNTASPSATPTLVPTTKIQQSSIKLQVEEYKQKYALSCESAAASIAMKYVGVNKTEDQVLATLPYDNTKRTVDSSGKITWGDPYKAFVGDYKGIFHQTGYGVYAEPIAEAVIKLGGKSQVLENGTLDDLYNAVNDNKPVVVWVPTRFEIEEVKYWFTPEGKKIPWIQHEHAMVFRGYDKAKKEIYLMDVATGKYQTKTIDDFIRGWGYLGNQGVIISK